MDDFAVMDDGHSTSRPQPDCGASLVSWMLLLMGIAGFTPCILIPEWQAYRDVRIAEQRERHYAASWEKRVERERRLMEAIQTDPTVVSRLAQRELGFRNPESTPVRVAVASDSASTDQPFVPEAVPPPQLVARIQPLLPNLDYERVFGIGDTRTIIMVMSVVVMGVGMWMPARRRKRNSAWSGAGKAA